MTKKKLEKLQDSMEITTLVGIFMISILSITGISI